MILPTHRRSSDAFTLIELVVVLVLIAIMAAMIVPQMQGSYEDALLRSTGRKLISAFQLAYSRAVSMNQPQRVRLDSISHRYVLEQLRHRGLSSQNFEPLPEVNGSEGSLDPRISIEIKPVDPAPDDSGAAPQEEPAPVDASSITFYPDGTADPAKIALRDRAGFQLVMIVNPVTARVEIVDDQNK